MSTQAHSNNNRMVLLLVAGIPVTMLLAASWLWWFVVRGDLDLVGLLGTANRGQLVQPPRPLHEAPLRDEDGLAISLSDLEPRWALLVAWSGPVCDVKCERLLYLTRQIHTAMGKEYKRIRRLLVSPGGGAGMTLSLPALSDGGTLPGSVPELLDRDHRGLRDLRLERASFDALFPEQREASDTWYLVDPRGWIMMSYDDGVSYKDVIADLKFLLKNSSE